MTIDVDTHTDPSEPAAHGWYPPDDFFPTEHRQYELVELPLSACNDQDKRYLKYLLHLPEDANDETLRIERLRAAVADVINMLPQQVVSDDAMKRLDALKLTVPEGPIPHHFPGEADARRPIRLDILSRSRGAGLVGLGMGWYAEGKLQEERRINRRVSMIQAELKEKPELLTLLQQAA